MENRINKPIVLSGYGAAVFVLTNNFMDEWFDKYGDTPQAKVRAIRFEGSKMQKTEQEVEGGIKIPVIKIIKVPLPPDHAERLAAAEAECRRYDKEENEYILKHLFEEYPYEYYEEYCKYHKIKEDRLKCDSKAFNPSCDLTCSQYLECRGKKLGGE